jgi:hypothetical protein
LCTKKFWRKNLCRDFSVGKIISFLFTNWLENFNMNFCILQQTCQFQNEVQKVFVKSFMKSSVTWFTSTADTWSQNVVEKNSNQILIFPIGWHFSDQFWTLQKICGSGFISWKK